MNCSWTRRNLPLYLDGRLSPVTAALSRLHLRHCSKCLADCERIESADSWTRLAAPVRPPAGLRTRIHVALSHELERETWAERAWLRLKLRMREAVQPIAIRAAGGLAAAVLLFGVLMPDIWVKPVHAAEDVPLRLLSRRPIAPAMVMNLGPYGVSGNVTVLAFIDAQGNVYDIDLPAEARQNAKLCAQIANALLFSRFAPATFFGRPVRGAVMINFTTYDVKG